jgi:uncharacterized protein DUF6335
MARRKTPRAARRRPAPKRGRIRRPRRAAASARKKSSARKSASPRKTSARPAARKASARARKASARPRKASARLRKPAARLRKATARPAGAAARKASRKASTAPRKIAGRRKVTATRTPPRTDFVARRAPSLDRERRIVRDDDVVPTPPSSLDLDRSASAARSGRRELHERFVEHTETSPAITGGDIDADWESAYSVGDEAPGGDNPTPDQDIVDDIGRAVGVQYEDNEELKGEAKIADRDRKRWELDPASSEDYNDR